MRTITITREDIESVLSSTWESGIVAWLPGYHSDDGEQVYIKLSGDELPEITSGLGIGGAGSEDYNIHTEAPVVPATTSKRCRICGSSTSDGAMFTTTAVVMCAMTACEEL